MPAEEPSDIEEGGLDLNVPFKPIGAYISNRQEMLEQCFRVLGENKLKKMLPDELKVWQIKTSSLISFPSLLWCTHMTLISHLFFVAAFSFD